MTNPDFEKNLFITYLDEVKSYDFGDYCFNAIVSMSMNKNYYKNNIETKWRKLREKYGIEEGVCLHFTDIKALLNSNYFNRKGKDRNEKIEKVFCNENILDKEKLYNFYIDIVNLIEEMEIDILVTGIRHDKGGDFKEHKKQLQSIWYTLFKQHLDNLAECLTFKSDSNKKKKVYPTKLIFDGNRGLESRDDIRYAYSDAICNGTSTFNAIHCLKCFDNLKFVGKEEVGFSKGESHAGNEILDFIALYAGKYFSKDEMISDYVKYKQVSKEEAEKYFQNNTKIYIDKKEIYPNEVIEKKIYKNKVF